MTSPSPSGGGWLGRLAAARGAGTHRGEADPPPGAATQPPPAPSPGTRAKAEATKRYIENLYSERNKAAAQRLERRRSLNAATADTVRSWRWACLSLAGVTELLLWGASSPTPFLSLHDPGLTPCTP
jgi:hypothetical protein